MGRKQFRRKNIAYYRLYASPLYGLLIGVIMYAFNVFCLHFGFGQTCFALIGMALPVLFGGGACLKDFMTVSAKLTVTIREKIGAALSGESAAKEPDSGVYATTAGIVYGMLYAGGLSIIWKDSQLTLLGVGYIISGTLHAMGYVWFPESDMQKGQAVSVSAAGRRTLRIILSVILALCFCTCIAVSPIMGVLEALLCMWIWTYYYYMSKRLCGGITEELAGYFLALCELAVVLFVGMFGRVLC